MFKERLKVQREKLGLSQEALAKEVCVTQQFVAACEKGIRTPNIDILAAFAEALQCTTDYLLGRGA